MILLAGFGVYVFLSRNRQTRQLSLPSGQLVAYTKLEDGPAQSFRTRAYDKAIDAINAASSEVADMSLSELKAIEGVGDSTALKIIEFVEHGSISKVDRLKQRFPSTMLDLMKIPGLGPEDRSRAG